MKQGEKKKIQKAARKKNKKENLKQVGKTMQNLSQINVNGLRVPW